MRALAWEKIGNILVVDEDGTLLHLPKTTASGPNITWLQDLDAFFFSLNISLFTHGKIKKVELSVSKHTYPTLGKRITLIGQFGNGNGRQP